MKLARKWENPEPQTEIVNGKEVITTKSVLMCNAEGMEIQAATSGQEFGKSLAEQLNLKAEMDAKYPGLYDLLMDPYGSLYLNEGMYEKALAFLEDQVQEKGNIFLPTIFDGNDLKNEMVRLALGRLMPRCDVSTYDRFINGLEDTGVLTGMNEKEGWDVHYLNSEMMEMLWKDCKTTDERVKTDPVIRWQEENRVFTSSMSDAMTQLSKAVVMYLASQSQPAEKTGEKPLGKVKEKIKSRFGKDNAGSIEKEFTDTPFDEAGKLKPNVKYQTGEYKYNYETDANGRVTNWNADNLQLTKRTSRLKHNSNTLGKLEGDQAGHLAGDRFGGSSKLDNIVSQSKNVNMSQYKKIENQWAKAIKERERMFLQVSNSGLYLLRNYVKSIQGIC